PSPANYRPICFLYRFAALRASSLGAGGCKTAFTKTSRAASCSVSSSESLIASAAACWALATTNSVTEEPRKAAARVIIFFCSGVTRASKRSSFRERGAFGGPGYSGAEKNDHARGGFARFFGDGEPRKAAARVIIFFCSGVTRASKRSSFRERRSMAAARLIVSSQPLRSVRRIAGQVNSTII